MDIKSNDLIAKFKYAYDNKWGYIYGKAVEMWTRSKQDALVRYFVNLYGSGWKTNASAKKNDRYYGAVHGSKWIGRYVVDCSGLFYWAFKQLGGYMYHGSNTMYNKYCTSKGQLNKKGRTDGKTLKPGTAVFTGNASSHGHVGLYIGNDTVVEAAGTTSGVITTKISNGKWTYWGELKGVIYDDTPDPRPDPGCAFVTGNSVALRYGPTTASNVVTRIANGTQVKLTSSPIGWEYVSSGTKRGFMMAMFLQDEGGGTFKVTGKSVALRTGPTTSANVLTRIATNSKVKSATLPTDWKHVTYGTKEGFMMKQYLKE